MPIVESIIGTIASGSIKGVFEGIGSLAKDIREAITGEISADKKAEIMAKAQEIEFAASKTQTDINLEEAKNPNVFVSGWRPACGWVCDFALAYNFILQPIATWALKIWYPYITPPTLDTGSLITILFALLGLGSLRTYEKLQNAQGNH